ncbi:hypothetical protein [Beihai picorna-like virus 99]|uniref:hypothetical protein n=1 Tax=Beihai picorna-like virus 99 TaxID=1922644 RepID=UPI00090AE20C|nr:hypothetical protein [Beihai picorna-like virus 99]APG76782.1 hypothetical protein [Beihai picorna-like virus 99]
MEAVDAIEEVIMEGNLSTTLRVQITKFQEYRRRLYQLKKQGVALKKKLESVGQNSFYLKLLNERMKKLDKILSQNTGAYVGSQRKFKPHVIYLYGPPKVGKSVLVDHLYSDLFQVLGEEEYLPGVDRHTLNPMDEFYDSYQYNRVVDIQDLFQMKNEEARNQELYSLIHMADETPYSLKIAECSGKGSTFFCSEHMMLTSNFDLANQQYAIESLVTSYDAVYRRINVYAEVTRDMVDAPRFDRDLMHFDVRQNEGVVRMDWYQFVQHCARSVIQNRIRSEGVMDLSKDENVNLRLSLLKTTVHEEDYLAQALEIKKTFKEKIEALIAYLHPTYSCKLSAYINAVCAKVGWGSQLAADLAVAKIELQSMFALSIGKVMNFAVDWLEVFALGAIACASFSKMYYCPSGALPYAPHQSCAVGAHDFVSSEGGIANLSAGVREVVARNKKQKLFRTEGGFGNLSGGVKDMTVAKKQQKRFRTEGKDLKSFLAEGTLSSNMQQVRGVCTRNLGRVCGVSMATHCFGLFEHIVALPEHVVQNPDDSLRFTVFNNVSFTARLSDLSYLVLSAHHLIIVDLSAYLVNYPPFSDVYRRVWKAEVQASTQGLLITSRTGMTGFDFWGIALESVKMLDSTVAIRMKNGKRFCFSKGLCAFGATENGDCGAPWILDSVEGAYIVGLHVGGTQQQKCSAALINKDLILYLKKYFQDKNMEPVEYEAAGTEFDPPEGVNTVDVKGRTDTYVFQPRKTKIHPSPFMGLIPQRTAPAILKPVVIQDELGKFMKVSPLVLNFEKNFINKKQFSASQVNKGLNLLADWYLPAKLPRNKRMVLTLEQAIFGDETDLRNDSINGKAGIGWPWMEKFQSRKQLVDLSTKFIHPDLRLECDKLMTLEGCDQNFLFVEMLKDERLPLEKVNALKTRVFTMLPLHVNIVLKRLFGHFVMYLMEKHDVCPAKIGISQKPDDWSKLYTFLDNGGQYIAGDYSAFDKCMHYELMEGIGRMANEFYDDEYSHLRLKLLKKVFCSYRLVDGVVFQTFGGMPSGCYLTASFNSMVNALYWYIFLAEHVDDTERHKDWFRLATFGDDHVVAVYNQPHINQVTFSEWLKRYGLSYTTPIKGTIVEEYIPFEQVTFLKRSFRFDGVRYWGPLDLDTILDSAQWYRVSSSTKALTPEELCNEIYSNVLLELVHHGKEVYDEWTQKMKDFVRYDLTISHRSFVKTQEIFLNSDPNTLLPITMNATDQDYQIFQALSKACAKELEIEYEAQGDNDIAPPKEKETVLGTAVVENARQGLTHFTEQVDSSIAQTVPTLNTPIDDMFEIPSDFFKMCNRWLSVGKQAVVDGDPTGGPILRIDPMNFLIEDSFIREKIASTTFVRYTMEVQLKVVATKFHYGAYIVVWRPYYAAGQSALAFMTATDKSDEIIICAPMPTGKRQYSMYDTIFTASQCPHTVLSLTAKNTVKIPIPWNIPFQYVPTAKMTDPRYHPGYLDVYKITPTGPANVDAPEFAIFAAFTEVRGWGYKSEANPPRKLVYVPTSDGTWATVVKSSWNVPLPVLPSISLDPVSWTKNDPAQNIVDTFDAQAIDTKVEMERQTTGSWLMDTAHWILDTSRSILTLFAPLGPILGFFGLSRPADATPATRMLLTSLPMSNALGPDCCYTTAMNPYNLLEADKTPEEKLISTVAGIPTYLGWFKLSSTDPDKRVFSVSPIHTHTVGSFKAIMPAGYILNRFRFWRSSIKMHIRFFSSSFVSVRVAVYITYNDVGGRVGLVPTRVVDVNGDNECDIELPFMFQTPWYDDAYGFDSANMFNVTIEQITDIVSDEATEAKPVFVTMWASFPGLQVAGPCAMRKGDVTYTYKPAMSYDAQGVQEYHAQAEDLPGLGEPSASNGVKWAMNDIPASLYHLAKRYQPSNAVTVRPYLLPSTRGKSGSGANYIYVNDAPDYQYYAVLYRFFRCSINVISKNSKCIENINPFGESFRKGANDTSMFMNTDAYSVATMGVTNVRVPYRASTNYLPSPTFGFDALHVITPAKGQIVSYSVTGAQWSNPLEQTSYGAAIGTNGILAPEQEKGSFHLAAADDLDYHTYIGTPLVSPINLVNWYKSFKKITS